MTTRTRILEQVRSVYREGLLYGDDEDIEILTDWLVDDVAAGGRIVVFMPELVFLAEDLKFHMDIAGGCPPVTIGRTVAEWWDSA